MAVFAVTFTQSGCSLFVMAGKMLFGDPMVTSDFQRGTGVNLARTGDRVLLYATAPAAVRSQYPALELDVQEGVAMRLRRAGIQLVDADEINQWMDGRGGRIDDLDQVSEELEADYIVHFDIRQFSHREMNSNALFRGQARGEILVYRAQEVEGQKQALAVYSREFSSIHPKNYAVSAEDRSDVVFQKEYLDRFCKELALKFYSHRMGEEVE